MYEHVQAKSINLFNDDVLIINMTDSNWLEKIVKELNANGGHYEVRKNVNVVFCPECGRIHFMDKDGIIES